MVVAQQPVRLVQPVFPQQRRASGQGRQHRVAVYIDKGGIENTLKLKLLVKSLCNAHNLKIILRSREHRLYQADWLLRYYHFQVSELLSEDRPDFNIFLDPKCDWALRHLEYFPVEINKASYQTLLRVPGIGYKSAERIVKARKRNRLNFDDLKKIGVVLKRALYFITCSGKMMYNTKLEENYICENLMRDKTQLPKDIRESGYQQLSFFDKDMRSEFQLTDARILPPGQQIVTV